MRSPDFNLLSDQEYLEEEEADAMAETMEQYMSKTRTDYRLGVARPKIDNKDQFELKRQFLKELRENTFSGSDNEDANEHIEKVFEIVNLFHVPKIIVDQLMLRVFLISLTRAASRWLRNEPSDEEVSLVDGVLEGALGALEALEWMALVGMPWMLIGLLLVYDLVDDVLVIIIWKGFMGREWIEKGMNLN
ncbi:hypothetical protein Tco_1260588 [Tanacetum coccineum]